MTTHAVEEKETVPVQHSLLDRSLDGLQTAAVNFAQRFIRDARVRHGYIRDTRSHAALLRDEVAAGRMTVDQAARHANELRYSLM